MKLPRLITRRRAKWAGVIAVVVLVVSFVVTQWFWVSVRAQSDYTRAVVEFQYGRLYGAFGQSKYSIYATHRGWFVETGKLDEPYMALWMNRPRFEYYGEAYGHKRWGMSCPLWLPLLLIAVPTAYLWRADRRAKPWQCAKCRYDLRGLDGGVCPECGNPTECKT